MSFVNISTSGHIKKNSFLGMFIRFSDILGCISDVTSHTDELNFEVLVQVYAPKTQKF